MSKVKIQGNASGTGVITLIAPNTNTDRTVTLPDESITLAGGVDGVTSNATSNTLTINDGVFSIGPQTPESWHTSYEAIQLGAKGTLWDVGDEFQVGSNFYYDSAYKYTTAGEASRIKQQDGRFIFSNAPTGSADGAVTWTDRLEVTSDGRGLSQFTVNAWVDIDGTGTVAISDSHNVSSITDHGTGRYLVNFTNALSNSNYTVSVGNDVLKYSATDGSGNQYGSLNAWSNRATTSVRVAAIHGNSADDNIDIADRDSVTVSIIGD